MVVWEITTVSDAQFELENVTMIGCVHEQQKTTKTNTETKQYKVKESTASPLLIKANSDPQLLLV